MSLLLDALKKAEKDKEAKNASSAAVPVQKTEADVHEPSPVEEIPEDNGLTLEELSDSQPIDIPEPANQDSPVVNEPPLDVNYDRAPRQVSDEALQVLIYKTNHAHRRRRKLIWAGAAAMSAAILVVSGLYFFNQIQQGIGMLELRHRVDMRAIESEPVKTKNLQLLADNHSKTATKQLDKPSQPKKAAPIKATEKKPAKKHAATKVAHRAIVQRPHNDSGITVVRSKKQDPVGDLLTRAWTAYNTSDYLQASQLYTQVLAREKNNRDALMGLAAIAIKNNDRSAALDYYGKMLQLDPRDPVANAAIVNLNNNVNDETQSVSRLLYLIRLEPDAAHLYYALGNKYAEQSRWPEAESAYFSAFENDSSSADYAYNLAVSLERIGRSKQAIQYYQAALQLAKNNNVSFSPEVVKKRLSQIQP